MSSPIFFAPLRVPLTDARTGLMSREWYLFFQALWLRSGGSIAQSNDDLLQNNATAMSSSDVLALTQSSDQDFAQAPLPPVALASDDAEHLIAQLSFVRDQVSEILKALQDIQQAVVVN